MLKKMATAAQAAEAKQIRAALLQRLTTRVELICPKRGPSRKLTIPYVMDRILHVCSTGCSWRDLEVQGGSPKTVYHHFNRWSRQKVLDLEFYELAKQYSESQGQTRGNLVADTSFVKNVHGRNVVGKCPVDRGRKATKVSVLADTHGAPLAACYHAANKNDCTTLAHLLAHANTKLGPLSSYQMLLADKGYDTEACRNACLRHGLLPIIDHKRKRALQGVSVPAPAPAPAPASAQAPGPAPAPAPAPAQAPGPAPIPALDPHGAKTVMMEHVFGRLDQKRRLRAKYESTIWNFRSFHSIGFRGTLSGD